MTESQQLPPAPQSRVDAQRDCSALDPYEVRIGGVRADPYRIARAYDITDPVLFQALKKLLRCGRKHKDIRADAREARTTIERWEAMNAEDAQPNTNLSDATKDGGQPR